ncbi:MAG: type VI secretion system Vgr family protein [Gemmataceae bacterium]
MAPEKTTQENRPILIKTPLKDHTLLLESFEGEERISTPFVYNLTMLAEDPKEVKFDKLLGGMARITIDLPKSKKRYITGIIVRLVQGAEITSSQKDVTFVRYRAKIVPEFWLFRRNVRNRIFQQKSVPDILKEVLKGIKVKWEIKEKYEPRDYCVQYRESDFAFASRLMEEEGIYYFFTHTEKEHEMVVCDTSKSHPDTIKNEKIRFEESGTNRIYVWEKIQELSSGKVSLWDRNFELPEKNLKAEAKIQGEVKVGDSTHKLKVGDVEKYELYDYPGGYANRFDGIKPGGAENASELQKIFKDNERTVKIRLEQELVDAVVATGGSDCRYLITGHKFTLEQHFDANGDYLLTFLRQKASIEGAYTIGGKTELAYNNSFECIPSSVTFRPKQTTPKPFVKGTQTALVVGPSGQEIFTDKYGRVKVQFYWDRDGKKDANSSCWIRVGQSWAGKSWGAMRIPRIGQEVIVAFLEGDPNAPIIVGSVYNAEQMPPYVLPDNMTMSGFRSRSSLKGKEADFNELTFEDKKDKEIVYLHAQKDSKHYVENNEEILIGNKDSDDGSQTITIWKNKTETIEEGDDALEIKKGSRTAKIKKDDTLTVEGKQTITITGETKVTIEQANYTLKVSAGTITIDASKGIDLKVGSNTVSLTSKGIEVKGGEVTVSGKKISIG